MKRFSITMLPNTMNTRKKMGAYLFCSRAAYLRQLIVLDRERQAGKA